MFQTRLILLICPNLRGSIRDIEKNVVMDCKLMLYGQYPSKKGEEGYRKFLRG